MKVLGIIAIASGGGLYLLDQPITQTLGVGLMLVGLWMHFRGRQHAARRLAHGTASPLSDDRPDILYLRSFTADPSTLGKKMMSGFSTEEEELARALAPIGDLVAIGRPQEGLPLPGAARMYASDDEWQGMIVERMAAAPLVVIRIGTGAGVLWECAQAVARVSPERLVILVLATPYDDYVRFAGEFRRRFDVALPDVGRTSALHALVDVRENSSKATPGVIMFSDGWNARFTPLPFAIARFGNAHLRGAFATALAPVIARAKAGVR